MDNKSTIIELNEKVKSIEERLLAIELEQRKIIEDILSGEPTEHLHRRIIGKPKEKISKKEKIIENSKIEI